MSEYTQGVCCDGAAILKDGQPMTVEHILEALQERDSLQQLAEGRATQRDALSAHVARIISEWNSGDDLFSDEWIERMGETIEDAPEHSLGRRDQLKQAEALFEMASRLEAYCQPIAANQCWNRADSIKHDAENRQ